VTDLPRFDLVDVVARDYDATIAFYRALGVDLEPGPEGEIRHAEASFGDLHLHVDNEHLASLYNASWRAGEQVRVVLGFKVPSRDAVDERYASLTAAGYAAVQPPFDAFWGARYAIVADPDGNHVGLMSPSDDAFRHWPPVPSPSPAP
jgi:uncharacterized glyoxalase superfamily protein PhnB